MNKQEIIEEFNPWACAKQSELKTLLQERSAIESQLNSLRSGIHWGYQFEGKRAIYCGETVSDGRLTIKDGDSVLVRLVIPENASGEACCLFYDDQDAFADKVAIDLSATIDLPLQSGNLPKRGCGLRVKWSNLKWEI